MKKTIGIITNAGEYSGVGSRAHEIARRIRSEDMEASLVFLDGEKGQISEVSDITSPSLSFVRRGGVRRLPGALGSKSISWIRLAKKIPSFDIYDLSNQSLAFIAKTRHPSVVTVHDLIELTHPQDAKAKLLNQYLMGGISRSDKIIAVSEYTKREVCDYFGIHEENIAVIPNGVREEYVPIENFASTIAYQHLLQEYGLSGKPHVPLLLHVGSDHPRKNLSTVLRVLAMLKKQYPNILLIKIGTPGILSGRQAFLEGIDTLRLRENVKILGTVSPERMNELYNIATALVFPSYYEGFGLPLLEAMAAGCPVVCSNTTSLPEVAGDGAILHDPDNAEAFAKSIEHIIHNADFKNSLVERGVKQAAKFSWDAAARDMVEIYKKVP